MQKVIGLDIGSYSIKAVEIVNTFKSYEITNFYENIIPVLEGVPVEAIVPSAMEQLFAENNLEADRIVTAMPGQFISSRVLTFNFTDARKIQAAVYGEVEDTVPFNMDDMIVDHHVLGTSNGKTTALAVMTRKAFLRNFLELLQRINIDPKLVDVDSLAFYNLSSYMRNEPGKSVAIVDVGHEKTSVCIVRDGLLRMFRSINLGGRYITEFLARDLETGYHEAQRIKHEVSRVLCSTDQGEDLSPSDRTVVERTTLAANAIIKELGRTIYAFKSVDKEPLTEIVISGGTSKLHNFARLLEDQLEIPTSNFHLDQADIKMNADLLPHTAIMPQSVAIGMRTVLSVKHHSQINLRRGEFAYVQNYENIIKVVRSASRVIGLALALLIVSYGVKRFFYKQQIDALQAQYVKEYTEIFPDAKKKPGAAIVFERFQKDAESRLTREIDAKRRSIDDFATENSGGGALVLLKYLSTAIPKTSKVDVTLYNFKATGAGTGQMVLKAETDGYATQAEIIAALKKVPVLKDVVEKASGAKPGSSGAVIEFTVQANYVAEGASGRAS